MKNRIAILKITTILITVFCLLSCDGVKPANPLLATRNTYIDFEKLKASHIAEALAKTLTDYQVILDGIIAMPAESRTYENSLLARDELEACIWNLLNPLQLMTAVHPDEDLRNAADSAIITLSKLNNDLQMNRDLYLALRAYSDTEEAQRLTEWKKKYLADLLRSYQRNGMALEKSKRDKVQGIKDRLSDWSLAFDNNLADYRDTVIYSESEMKGLPEYYKSVRQVAPGKYAVDLSYPSYQPFMELAESNAARRQLYLRYNNRAVNDNLKLLRVILRERKQLANILGFDSFAALVVDNKMAQTPSAVWEFEDNLVAALQPKADQEYQELLELKSRQERKPTTEIFAWEKNYYFDQLAKTKYHLDNEIVREYLPTEIVINGIIEIISELFDVSVTEVQKPRLWYTDVKLFEVSDSKDKQWIGSFYLDLYPRDGKFSHAACFDVAEGKLFSDGYQKPVFAIVCNFQKPENGMPSLLSHDQVVTLFHEFGHGLHNLFTESVLMSQAGTRVEQDFVETPSQVLESWAWDKSVLKRIARHYKTGESISDELVDKLITARNMTAANNILQQSFYGQLDFYLHEKYNPFSTIKTGEIVQELQNSITKFPYVPGTAMEASFGHLIDYAAGYYGYLWSEVYAKDIFSVFKTNGVMDKQTAKLFRKNILACGGTRTAEEMIVNFLGREPDNSAFIKDIDL